MTTLEHLQQHHAVDLPAPDSLTPERPATDHPPIVTTIVERLRAGVTFVDLLDDNVENRAADLAAVLEHLAGDPVKLVWTGNPLRSPLTIERLILQAAGPEADLRLERTPEQLAHMLTLAPDAETGRTDPAPLNVIVIVQQPETLDPIARETLAHMAPHLARATRQGQGQGQGQDHDQGQRHSQVQFLFCGTSAFHPIEAVAPQRTDVALRHPLPPPLPEPGAAHRREALPLLLLLAITIAGSFWATPITSARPPETARAAALPTQPAAPPAAQAAAQPAPPPIDIAALRRDFDQFLAEQPTRWSTLTQAERDTLFDEYLQRARKPAPSPPPQPALPAATAP